MIKPAALLLLLPLGACAALEANTQGPLQPQSVSGPCEVKRFFLLGLRSVPVEETVRDTGEACRFTLVNPALNVVVDAALLTGTPAHGTASAGLLPGARQAVVSYTPAPGFRGKDRFSVTLEPNAVGVTVDVTVTGP